MKLTKEWIEETRRKAAAAEEYKPGEPTRWVTERGSDGTSWFTPSKEQKEALMATAVFWRDCGPSVTLDLLSALEQCRNTLLSIAAVGGDYEAVKAGDCLKDVFGDE